MAIGDLIPNRFADWVDSFGEDAGDHMVVGMLMGALVAGALGIFVGLALMSVGLVIAGFAVFIVHMVYGLMVM